MKSNISIIDSVDWCLIQYFIGYNINSNYFNFEETFKMLLKQYILFFNITSISSRDKKFFLQDFTTKFKQFENNKENIIATVKEYLTHQPNDDLIISTLEVLYFYWKFYKINKLEIFSDFIADNNKNLLHLFMTVGKKIINTN